MSIKTKIAGAVCLVVLAYTAGMVAIQAVMIAPRFSELERRDTGEDVTRVQNALAAQIAHIDDFCQDYAAWDETYENVTAPSEKFVQANFERVPLRRIAIHAALLIAPDGKPSLFAAFSPDTFEPFELSLFPDGVPDFPLPAKGLYSTAKGPLMLSCRPVTDSSGKAPARGALCLGRFVTEATRAELSDLAQVDLAFWDVSASPALPPDAAQALDRIGQTPGQGATGEDAGTIRGYAQIPDIYGKPLIFLRIEQPKNIIIAGQRTMTMAAVMVALCGLALLAALIVMLSRMVTGPLTQLTAESVAIGAGGDFAKRLRAVRDDEIGVLAREFNALLGHLADINATLDHRVRERTRELSLANRELLEKIAALTRAENRLELAAKIFEHSIEGIIITDAHADIIYVNRAFTAITGYAPEEVMGVNPRFLKSDRHDAAFFTEMWETIRRDGVYSGEIWNRRKNGEAYPERLSIIAVKEQQAKVTAYIAVFHDVSDLRRSEEKLALISGHDGLTGLPNRNLLLDRLSMAITRAQRERSAVAVFFLGLDRFQGVNDSLGHLAGDALLKDLTIRLGALFREADTISRFGGDEFVVVAAHDGKPAKAARVAGKIIAVCSKPFSLSGQEVFITGSVGVALYPSDGRDPETLLQKATIALGLAKQSARGGYRFYTADMQDRAQRRLSLETQIRQGLAAGEFNLFYQPKVAASSGRLAGAEALMRWTQAGGGSVPPQEFIALAEESGLINELGNQALTQACRQIAAWKADGRDGFQVAVNISAKQLAKGDFAGKVQRILRQTGCPPHMLELEITESTLVADLSRNLDIIQNLSAHGVSFALDDFGTGYSSLSYLQNLPIGTLKIDKAFVSGLGRNKDSEAIIGAVVSMAKGLNLTVVAEGVETQEQLDYLRSISPAIVIQGFYYGRPCPPEEFERFFGEY